MIIAFTASWKLTIIMCVISPLIMIAGKIRANMRTGFSAQTDEAYKESGNLVAETVCNIRTVFSFGNKEIMTAAMEQKLK